MHVKYEGALFNTGLDNTIEKMLLKQAIKKKIRKLKRKTCKKDPYLTFATEFLSKHQNPIIIDIGSNIGTTVLPLAIEFPHAKFYAIEPHPVPAGKFVKNAELNKIKNVTLSTCAIGPEEKLTQIYTCPTNCGGHRLTGFKGREIESTYTFGPIQVHMKPLNNFFNDFNLSQCHLLKIDTEGYEVFILESLKDKLNPAIVNCIIAEFGPEGLRKTGKTGWDLISMMLNRGYKCKELGSNKIIESKKDVPNLPDFSVTDFIFYS